MMKSRECLAVLCAASILFSSVPVRAEVGTTADDLLFMEIPSVFAASRREEKLELAASNLTVITAEQIKAWGFRDLKDVLRVVPGYSVLYDRDEWVLSTRGLTSDNTTKWTMAIDGNIVNLLAGFGISNLMDLPNDLNHVKQIEIIRGPGSISWGNNASAGVINIVTKNAADMKKMHRLDAKVGTEQTFVQSFQVGQVREEGEVDLTFNATIAQSLGQKIKTDASNTNAIRDVVITPATGSRNGSTGRYTTALDRIEPSYRFQAKARVGNLKLHGFAFSQRNYNRNFEIDKGREIYMAREQINLASEWTGTVLNDKVDLTFRLSGGNGQQTYDTEVSPATTTLSTPAPQTLTVPAHTISEDRRVLSSSLEGATSFLEEKLRLTMGVDNVERRMMVGNINAATFNPPNASGANTGGFVRLNKNDSTFGIYESLTFQPVGNVTFVAGLRSDHNASRGSDENKWIHSPRGALMWEPSNKNVLKLVYNSGFLRPDGNQQISSQQPGAIPLVPEEVSQLELIYIQQMGKLNLTTTLFDQKAKKVLFLGDGSVGSANTINGQDESSRGVEMELSGMVGQHRVFAGGAWFENKADGFPPLNVMLIDNRRFDEDDNRVGAFTKTLNAGVAARLLEGLTVAPMVRYIAPIKYRLVGAPTGSPVSSAVHKKTDTVVYLDLNVNWDLNDAIGFSLYGNNIADNREELPHAVRNGTYQPYGRYLEGKVTLHW